MQSGCTLDYGSGFYTTTSEKQSQAWVLRRMLEKCLSCGYVNVYDFDDNKLLELNCLLFAETNKEWAAFVLANRTQTGYSHDYDVVYGPVANDKVYLSFRTLQETVNRKHQILAFGTGGSICGTENGTVI